MTAPAAAVPPIEPRPIVMITGGSAGIGLAIAHVFAARGHALALVARDEIRLAKAADELRSRHGVAVARFALDLSRDDAEGAMIDFAARLAEPVGILVNNAGMFLSGPLVETRTDDIVRLMRTNIGGVHGAVRAVVPGMKTRGSGRILNVGSLAGFAPTPSFSAYGASKAFVNSATLAMREELSPFGISVSLLAPGPVRTELVARQTSSALTRWAIGLSTETEVVAECAYKGVMSGEAVIVPGLFARALRLGMGVLPASANAWVMGLVQRSLAAIEAPGVQ